MKIPCSRAVSWILLILLGLCAALLRVNHFGNISLFRDEPAVVSLASSSWSALFTPGSGFESNGWLYYLAIQGPWMRLCELIIAFPPNSWYRLSSTIFGLASLFAVYALARKCTNLNAALFACAFLAINGFHHYYSCLMRFNMFNLLMVTLSGILLWRAIKNHHWLSWTLYALSTVMCISSMATSFAVFPAHWLFLLLSSRYDKQLRSSLTILLPILVALAIGSSHFLVSHDPGAAARILWYPPTDRDVWINVLLSLAGCKQHLANPATMLCLFGVGWLLILGSLTILRQSLHSFRKKRIRPSLLILLWLVVTPLTLQLVSWAFQPLVLPRNCLYLLVPVAICLGYGYSQLPRTRTTAIVVLVFTVISIPVLLGQCRNPITYEWDLPITTDNLRSDLGVDKVRGLLHDRSKVSYHLTTSRQGLTKRRAVTLGNKSAIHDQHQSFITTGANQPAKALTKLNNRQRQRIFAERILSFFT